MVCRLPRNCGFFVRIGIGLHAVGDNGRGYISGLFFQNETPISDLYEPY